MIKDETSTGQTSSLTHYKNRLIMKVFWVFFVCFFETGERAGAGAADEGAATGQPAAVHPADRHQSHCAAFTAHRRGRQWCVHTHTLTCICKYTHFHAQKHLEIRKKRKKKDQIENKRRKVFVLSDLNYHQDIYLRKKKIKNQRVHFSSLQFMHERQSHQLFFFFY